MVHQMDAIRIILGVYNKRGMLFMQTFMGKQRVVEMVTEDANAAAVALVVKGKGNSKPFPHSLLVFQFWLDPYCNIPEY